jgi:hypothetical protein
VHGWPYDLVLLDVQMPLKARARLPAPRLPALAHPALTPTPLRAALRPPSPPAERRRGRRTAAPLGRAHAGAGRHGHDRGRCCGAPHALRL